MECDEVVTEFLLHYHLIIGSIADMHLRQTKPFQRLPYTTVQVQRVSMLWQPESKRMEWDLPVS